MGFNERGERTRGGCEICAATPSAFCPTALPWEGLGLGKHQGHQPALFKQKLPHPHPCPHIAGRGPVTAPMESVYSVDPAPDGAGPTSLDVLSFLDTLVNSTEEQCFSARSRSTVLQGLPFGGVPTVLAINFILWLVSRP